MSLKKSFLGRTASRTLAISKSLREHSKVKNPAPKDDQAAAVSRSLEEDSWGTLYSDLLGEIIRRVEASEDRWPSRRNVVSCACVCRKWRDVTKEIVGSSMPTGKITFPSCLKDPGPRDPPQQCLVRRDKKNSTFYLYLALNPSFTDKGKFLLAAKRCRHGAHTEYIISLDADDISQGSNTYVGKLRSDFLGTSFTIYDSQPPHNGVRHSNNKSSRRVASKQVSPQVPAGNFEIGQVSYKFNLLKSRGPRRMVCSVKFPLSESDKNSNQQSEEISKGKKCDSHSDSCTILSNKTPRWHEHLQCWCLNFHGRVTVASVKNFQLAATVDQSQPGGIGDEEMVLLQFGKVAGDTFTMDYRQPLSAFQAFAICLTSFGTKLACE